MANIVSKWKLVGILLVISLIIALIIILKPKSNDQGQNNPQKNQVIKIALPDLSANNNHSSGTILVDYIYLNKLLEQKFEKQDIKIEWHFFKGAGPAINEALVNNQADIAFLGDLAMIIGKANHIDTKLIAAVGRLNHLHLAVLPNKGYDSLEKLKGKSIAVWQGTAAHLSFYQFIQAHGYSEKDFRIINLDSSAVNAALATAKIDAGWGGLNILSLEQKNLVEVPLSTKNANNGVGTIQFGLIAKNQFIQQYPGVTQDIVNTLVEAAFWLSKDENRSRSIDLVTKNAGYPVEAYTTSIDTQSFKQIYNPILDDFYLQRLQAGLVTALDTKLIKQGFELKSWYQPKFVNQSIKQLNLEDYWH